MTLQDIIDHLSACVTDMNDDNSHDLALKAQAAIVAVADLQRACAQYGFKDEEGDMGDWPVELRQSPVS